MELNPYLQLTRAHTAPLETIPAIGGAALATGELWSVSTALWGLMGILYHLSGYGMNSYTDWKNEYDTEDPKKDHHPLNTGSMTPSKARKTVYSLFILTIVYTAILIYPSIWGYSIMALGALTGVGYNLYGKQIEYKFILISIAHTSVFVIPYISLDGSLHNETFYYATLYVFLWIVFQISVSGEIKDIMQYEERNFLRDVLGVYFNTRSGVRYASFSERAIVYSISVKGVGIIISGAIVYSLGAPIGPEIGVIAAIAIVIMIIIADLMSSISTHDLRKNPRTGHMAAIEILTLSIFVLSLRPLIGWSSVATLIIGSVLWVIMFNLTEWGTFLAPDV